ncbi:MAG: SDR family oxidoreductase, partial [Bacteroidetes bacterium]|nr:SDR family oxidoreductase [Bacteroidota bacterium]
MIKLKCADGVEANAYYIEAKVKSNNWIFVFQEWWGLNDHIKREAENLYNDLGNVNVIALDMYDGKLATDPQNAGKYMGEFKQARGTEIVKGAIAFAGPSAKIGTIGWCFGGGQSMQAALEASVRYLAADLGPEGVRVNAISAGPVRTLAAAGIAGFKKLYGSFADVAPLRSNITPEDVGKTAVWLCSDLSSAVTGE